MAGFTPKRAGGLANPQAGTGQLPEEAGADLLAWTPAPATSHIWGFRYYDARDPRFGLAEGRSQLQVRFREKGGGVSATYAYFFSSPEAGALIYDKLAGSAHPYGEVLHPLVIRPGAPYTRL